jgi:hypothetical protein
VITLLQGFVKRPALAPMYTALGLTSLDQLISNRKLRPALGCARETHGLVEAPSLRVPHDLA